MASEYTKSRKEQFFPKSRKNLNDRTYQKTLESNNILAGDYKNILNDRCHVCNKKYDGILKSIPSEYFCKIGHTWYFYKGIRMSTNGINIDKQFKIFT